MINDILLVLGISMIIQAAFFIFAATFKTDKVTDLSYGLTFITISLYFLSIGIDGFSKLLLVAMVVLWGLRLAGYLFIRILKTKTDKRFDGIREDFIKFAKFWILQGVSIWLIIVPSVIFWNSNSLDLNVLQYIAFGIFSLGLLLETVADYQKFIFKNDSNNKGKWIESGVWKYSRHPNYLGEMMVWWGIYIFVLPVLSGWLHLSIISPLYITILLLFVTGIPTLDKNYDIRYKGNNDYENYKKRAGKLMPKFK